MAAVIDLFSRRVVGWSMSAEMTAQLVTDALVMAIWRRGKPDALLHHSIAAANTPVRAVPEADGRSRRRLLDEPFGQRLGQCSDGKLLLVIEDRAFSAGTLCTRDEAKSDVFDYIERFYNPKRRHSTIGYLSPMEFEQRAGFA